MIRKKTMCDLCDREISLYMLDRHRASCVKKTKRRDPCRIDEISKKLENGMYSCNLCAKSYTFAGIATHYWLRHGDGQQHLHTLVRNAVAAKAGKAAWNKGLTVESDDRVRKMHATRRERSQSGHYKGTRGRSHTSATKEKLSAARARFLNEQGNGGFKRVKWYRTVDSFGNACSLRGSWEVKVADWLTLQNVPWTRRHYICYVDNEIVRTYAPDFFIPSDSTIIEVKGYYSDRDKRKMQLVTTQHPSLRIRILMKKEIEQLQTLIYNQM